MMDELTMGIIYAAKQPYPRQAIKDFLIKYTGSSPAVFTEKRIDETVERALCSCLNYVDVPSDVMRTYFHLREYPHMYSPFESAVGAMQNIQVKRLNYETDSYEYINGFAAMEEYDFD